MNIERVFGYLLAIVVVLMIIEFNVTTSNPEAYGAGYLAGIATFAACDYIIGGKGK